MLPEGTFAVVLAADDEQHLLKIESALRDRGIAHKAIREPDAPYNNSLMAIGVVPIADRKMVKPVLGKLRLLA